MLVWRLGRTKVGLIILLGLNEGHTPRQAVYVRKALCRTEWEMVNDSPCCAGCALACSAVQVMCWLMLVDTRRGVVA